MNGTKVDFSKLLASREPTVSASNLVMEASIPKLEGLTGISEFELVEEAEDGDLIAITDIYKQLSIHEDIILIIDKADEPKIRKALSAIKAKETAKLKSAGIRPDEMTLEFAQHPPIEGMEPGQIKLQVFFKRKATIKVHKVILPT